MDTSINRRYRGLFRNGKCLAKYLVIIASALPCLQATAQRVVNYDIALVRGLWKCDSSESIHLPDIARSSDLGSVLQLYITDRVAYLLVERNSEASMTDRQTFHCDMIEAHATELDSYLNEQDVAREMTGLRQGMVIQVKIHCGSFPFNTFARLNDNALVCVWNGQVQFFHRK